MTQTIFCQRTETGITNLAQIHVACMQFPIGKRLEVTVKLKSGRSTNQNNWYWECISILSKELGYEKSDMHEIVKYKFLKKEKVIESTGEILEYIESTSKLSKEDFSDFMGKLIQWSAETFNITLPIPDEKT